MYIEHRPPSTDSPEIKSTTGLTHLSTTRVFWDLLKTLPSSEPVPPAIIKFGLLTRQLEPYDESVSLKIDEISVKKTPEAVVPPETLRTVRYILSRVSSVLDSADKETVGQLCEVTGLNRQPEDGDCLGAVIKSTKEQNPMNLSCFYNQSATVSSQEQARTNNSRSESEHECPYCSKVCKNKDALANHKKACSEHPNPDYSCPYCSKSYDNKNALNSHKNQCSNSSNDTENKYKCPNCDKRFKNRRVRNKHTKSCKASTSEPDFSSGKSVKKDGRGERVAGKNPYADSDRLKDAGLHQGGG